MLHLLLGSTDQRRGSDDFRLREAYRELRTSLDSDGMLALNTTELPARGLTPAALLAQASTVPFLAEARLVVVEGLVAAAGGAKDAVATWQPLLDALSDLPPTNHLVLIEPSATRDQRAALGRSALLRALRKAPGVEVREFRALALSGRGGNEVATWVRDRARDRGIPLEPPAAERLSELLGSNLWALAQELEKLAQYARGRPIAVADVDLLTAEAREQDVFAIVDDAVEGRPDVALRRLQRQLADGSDSPMRIQALIARQLRHLVRAAALLEEGAERDAIADATGVRHPYPLRKLIAQAQAIGRPAAEQRLRAVEAADHAVKTGQLDEVLALELLIADAAGVPARERPRRRR